MRPAVRSVLRRPAERAADPLRVPRLVAMVLVALIVVGLPWAIGATALVQVLMGVCHGCH